MERIKRFEDHIRKYANAGINLTSLALGCSVKVDLYNVLYPPALSMAKKDMAGLNLDIAPREDVAVLSGREAVVSRLMSGGVDDVNIDADAVERFEPDAVVVLAQVYQGRAGNPKEFADAILRLYRRLGSTRRRVLIGKGGHSIVTTKPGTDMFVVDMIKTNRKDGGEGGYVLANNDTIQVIDPPTDDIASYAQASVAISNALNDLFVKGVHEKLTIHPVYDAPMGYVEELGRNISKFADSIGAKLVNEPQPNLGYLLIGATVTGGETDKEPPLFYDKIDEGFEVLVTGPPLGQLSVIGTFVTIHIDQDLMRNFEEEVMSVDELEELKNETMKAMMIPNIDVAKVIDNHLPMSGGGIRPTQARGGHRGYKRARHICVQGTGGASGRKHKAGQSSPPDK